MTAKKPSVYIIAGPNGAGKTTFAREFLPVYAKCKHFVNADLIAQGLEPFSPQSAAMKAGRLLLGKLDELAEKKVDFAFESTLSGKTYMSFLKALKEKGYRIHLFYLWVPTVDLALNRIKERVAHGGHHVPAKDVRRRFKRSLVHFLADYRPLADYWQVFDNSHTPPCLVARGSNSTIEVVEKTLFKTILENGMAHGKT